MAFGVKKIKQLLALASAFVVFAPVVAQPVMLASADSVVAHADKKDRKVDLKKAVKATVKYSKEVPVLKVTVTPTKDNYFVKGDKLNFKFDKKNVNLKNMQASAAKSLPFKYHKDGNYKLELKFTKTVKNGKFIQAYAIPTKEKGGKTAIKATFNDQKLKIKNNVIKSVDMFKSTDDDSDSDSSFNSNDTTSQSSSVNSTESNAPAGNTSQATTSKQATVTTFDPTSGTYTTAPSSDFFKQSPVQTSTTNNENYNGGASQTTYYQNSQPVNGNVSNTGNYYVSGASASGTYNTQNTQAYNNYNSQQVNTVKTNTPSRNSTNNVDYQAPAAGGYVGSTKRTNTVKSTNRSVKKTTSQKENRTPAKKTTSKANQQSKPSTNKDSNATAQKPTASVPETPTVNDDNNQQSNPTGNDNTASGTDEINGSQDTTTAGTSESSNVTSSTETTQTTSDQTNNAQQTVNSQQSSGSSANDAETVTTALTA